MLTDGEYIIRPLRLPPKVKAITTFDDSGFANIYVNDQISAADQHDAVYHELLHIVRDDAYNDDPIQQIEA